MNEPTERHAELELKLRDYFRAETEGTVPSARWWETVLSDLGEQERHWLGRVRLIPATRLGWASLALAAFLILGAASYTAGTVMDVLFSNAGGGHFEEAGLVQELELSKTIDGYTVALERAYADANQLIVGYTVSGPPDNGRAEPHGSVLTDSQGNAFPGITGVGVTGRSDVLGLTLLPGTGSYVTAYDTSAVQGGPAELDLSFRVELSLFASPGADPDPPVQVGPSTFIAVQGSPPESVVGPFDFELAVPFISGRVVDVKRTVEAAGISVTLERLVITPSETRAILSYDPPHAEMSRTALAALDPPGGGSIESSQGRDIDSKTSALSFREDLRDRYGRWILTVTELVDFVRQPVAGEIHQTRVAGPWVFRFEVPEDPTAR